MISSVNNHRDGACFFGAARTMRRADFVSHLQRKRPMDTNEFLEFALVYASKGWKVLPLVAKSKVPRIKMWQRSATSDESVIIDWWGKWPTANVGVKLGADSGIVDFECDSDEAERDYAKLWDGEPPVCPTFASARGRHRLFLYRDDLPPRSIVDIGKVGVRIGGGDKGAQSVFPPSIHPNGDRYRWLVSYEEVDPPAIPDAIVAKLWNISGEGEVFSSGKPPEYWDELLEGVPAGERNVKATELCGLVLRMLDDVQNNRQVATQWLLVKAWNEKNNPPLDEKELRRTFESVLRRERRRRANEVMFDMMESQVRRDKKSGKLVNTEWRLTIVTSEPPRYRIYSPCWDGYLEVDSSEYASPCRLRRAAVDQKYVWLPATFEKLWNGTKDITPLARVLLENADIEEDSEYAVRSFVIAEQLHTALTNYPRVLGEGDEVDSRGIPCVMPDGGYVFSFEYVWRPMSRSEDKVRRHELTALLKKLGATDYFPRIAGRSARRLYLPKSGFDALENILATGILDKLDEQDKQQKIANLNKPN